MSATESNGGKFALFKSIEFEGFRTLRGINPVEFDGVRNIGSLQ